MADTLVKPRGYALIIEDKANPRTVYGLLDESDPEQGGGALRITETERDGAVSITDVDGRETYTVSIGLVFDEWLPSSRSRAYDVQKIAEILAELHDPPFGAQPTVVFDTGGVYMVDRTVRPDLRWWISELTWGQVLVKDDVVRRRAVTVQLRQRVAGEPRVLAGRGAGKNRAGAYTVKAGETLAGIADRELGSARRAREIVRVDGRQIRDPKSIREGDRLALPE